MASATATVPWFAAITRGTSTRTLAFGAFVTHSNQKADRSIESRIGHVRRADTFKLCEELRAEIERAELITNGRFDCVICE